MNINRHNYEEFFLLYVDKELSAFERNAVAIFVMENPDLKIELDMLMQSVVSAETIVFENKNTLLKEEKDSLYQQKLMLYMDKELTQNEALEIEKLINSNEAIAKEYRLLQQVKLQVDPTIVFADKATLYRKESSKIIYLYWKRIAVAAILTGLGFWIGMRFVKTAEPVGNIDAFVKKNDKKLPAAKQVIETLPMQVTTKKDSVNELNTAAVKAPVNNPAVNPKTILPFTIKNKESIIQTPVIDNAIVKKGNDKPAPSNNLPKPLQDLKPDQSNKNDVANVLTPNSNSGNNKTVTPNPIDNTQKADVVPANNSYAITTAYSETNAEEKNENAFFTLSSEKVNRSKIGGFFRKVKRVLERNTSIKTGSSIKIAGFDIAIK